MFFIILQFFFTAQLASLRQIRDVIRPQKLGSGGEGSRPPGAS